MRRDTALESAATGAPIEQLATSESLARQLRYAIKAMRPRQWSKNALVLVAIVFAHKALQPRPLARGLLAFAAFCLTASMIYIINDLADRERDRQHPVKRERPLASGRLSVPVAIGTAAVCGLGAAALVALMATWALAGVPDPFLALGGSPLLFAGTLGSYAAFNIAYSLWLKHQVLWDVFVIAAGFVLRALAGAFAAPVPISTWFYLCATFLALFLALGKRRSELVRAQGAAARQRASLGAYTVQLLDQLLVVVVACALMTYSLYTFQDDNASHGMILTIPFVIFGVFRYLYLMYAHGEGERPDELLWRDRQVLGAVVCCVLLVVVVLYGVPALTGHALAAR
ncbi:MAG TPA: decaprenyl-phosphate phosphoribosyltransferase [Ktedonobacterales bacterium]|nr:decaprenyl-phosphate phosphoribosyltransferase [Ktedonobacterales bacterium]